MIPQSTIDQLISIPIAEVISKYATLKKNGTTWEACCPFHDEKTPSFKIFQKTNTYKCFGCGAGGNGIAFIMAKEGITFPEACRSLASGHGIFMKEEEQSDEQKATHLHAESLYVVNSLAASFFTAQLNDPANKPVLDYALSRWTEETIKLFEIGFAPDSWDGLLTYARVAGIKNEILLAAGLISERSNSPGKLYDYFRNRLIIPIHDKSNHILGFTGRAMSDDKAKYLNTRTTEIYQKGSLLFGLNFARQAIKSNDNAYLVEGNADVIKLHQIGVTNTVGICSTSFTKGQLDSLRDICASITIIPDSDPAGVKSIDRSAKLIIDAGMNCNILELPFDKDTKIDADSFFTDAGQFDQYAHKNITDYIVNKAVKYSKLPSTPANKIRAINEISDLIFKMDSSSHDLYIEQVSRLIKPKKTWTDKLKELVKEATPEVVKAEKSDSIPEHVSLSDWQKYGFYEDNNCYYFRTQRGIVRGCNFTMVPLFHIESVHNAKRIFRLTNEFKLVRVIEILQRDLISFASFKNTVESLGNFLFEEGENELNKLKRYLYQETKSCLEITQLGWQKKGFYAWGNGIFNGSFTKVDDLGIASHDTVNYYLPAFSTIWEKELQHYISERQFVHRDDNKITLLEYSTRLTRVFGTNATVALCFYFASLFRDIIIRKVSFFPILDLFGPKGAGKTELAVSLMSFFGKLGKGPNINNTSKAALADHVSQLCNACAHIDEYKNGIDLDKIEFLKGLWDGTGRTRMNMEKDKKKETTAVDCSVILSGQEMPTVDIALFSRLIYLTFSNFEYDDAAKKEFNELKAIEKLGNTHITNQILALRKTFKVNYNASYDQVSKDLIQEIGDTVIEDRIFRNWLVVLAAYHSIKDEIEVDFSYKELLVLSAQLILIQNGEIKKSNEISTFWDIVSFLSSDGMIHDGVDYRIEMMDEIKTEEMKIPLEFQEKTSVLALQYSKILPLYRKHGRQAGERILPIDSIKHYLKKDKRFLGTKRTRFHFLDTTLSIEGVWSSKPEWGYFFLYKDLGIDLATATQITDKNDEDNPEPAKTGRPSKFAIPQVYQQKKLSDEF
jgi:DNA primase catalytic core